MSKKFVLPPREEMLRRLGKLSTEQIINELFVQLSESGGRELAFPSEFLFWLDGEIDRFAGRKGYVGHAKGILTAWTPTLISTIIGDFDLSDEALNTYDKSLE